MVPVTVGDSGVIAAFFVSSTGLAYDKALGAGTLVLLPPPPHATRSITSVATKVILDILILREGEWHDRAPVNDAQAATRRLLIVSFLAHAASASYAHYPNLSVIQTVFP
jgi:hypothetical protein